MILNTSACVVLIWVGVEKSTQTEVCATGGALALRLNSTRRVAIPEPTPGDEYEKCGLESHHRRSPNNTVRRPVRF